MIRYRGGWEGGRWNYEACGSLFFFEVVLRAFGMVLGGIRGLLCRLVMGILSTWNYLTEPAFLGSYLNWHQERDCFTESTPTGSAMT